MKREELPPRHGVAPRHGVDGRQIAKYDWHEYHSHFGAEIGVFLYERYHNDVVVETREVVRHQPVLEALSRPARPLATATARKKEKRVA